jgi:FkbM family methyltransferase
MKETVKRALKATGLYATAERVTRPARWRQKQPRLLPQYQPFVQPGDLVFDIGANVGLYAGMFLDMGARVVAVEPQRSCQRPLQRLRRRHPGLTVLHAAVGSEPGTTTIYLTGNDTHTTLRNDRIDPADRPAATTETVDLVCLDQLIAKHGRPSFTKIDVEGFEPQVFAGLSEPLPALCFEYAPPGIDDTLTCLDTLTRLADGYRCRLRAADEPDWIDADWLDLRGFQARLRRRAEAHDPPVGDIFARLDLA